MEGWKEKIESFDMKQHDSFKKSRVVSCFFGKAHFQNVDDSLYRISIIQFGSGQETVAKRGFFKEVLYEAREQEWKYQGKYCR